MALRHVQLQFSRLLHAGSTPDTLQKCITPWLTESMLAKALLAVLSPQLGDAYLDSLDSIVSAAFPEQAIPEGSRVNSATGERRPTPPGPSNSHGGGGGARPPHPLVQLLLATHASEPLPAQ
eukprot:5865292-Pyramimonas_sp.AAC.1